ncbi:MAG: exodeoxyribonuclease V subunit gamma [Alteromonadaceae bacterium]|nr:exodeoxyribonuclease V subunit gamma [Alteromonadaceae bacterium]
MENLLVLFDKIQQISPLPVLSQEVIIVHNAGMQHWLNLSLAKQRGISMNYHYALPSQYLWQLLRSIASGNNVPQQTPYSREVLTWRIDALLASETVKKDEVFSAVNQYWQDENTNEITAKKSANFSEQALLKRFQLAQQLADLFEQYLIFRPQWLDQWQSHNSNPNSNKKNNQKVKQQYSSNSDFASLDKSTQSLVAWQAKLWQLLTAQVPYNPTTLIHAAIENIAKYKTLLPPRISFFGLNSMAPLWLEFISALSEYTEVHFFHLNPCYDYWGDLLTEKQALKTIDSWINDGGNDESNNNLAQLVGNPLLANFGQQGREFLALLQQYSTINIDAFEEAGIDIDPSVENQKNTCLQGIQNDILTLQDARQQPTLQIDDSITITSCHSALREVQALHDYLLHQFNNDKTLTPKDILVMCPQVENYAPYIDAVFSRGWQDVGEKVPPLPCSIADRVSKDSEPLVAAFIELLQLPDSRFQVSKLIALLRLPAMQLKFSLTLEEIDKISTWLEQASIHWGLDQQHKQVILGIEEANNKFTWQQGLSRLLLGFAYGDEDSIYQQQLLLADVEGNDALLLGQIMQILAQLQQFSQQMAQAKIASSWFEFLTNLLEELFVNDGEAAFDIINNALTALFEYCQEANYSDELSLVVVREFLQNHFSQPDPGKQFLVGQVTFCSMLPMRSIPFKVIAILGLNDGEFPRQRQPLGFDLMAMTPAKIGDRSRRGDDRYLFLEAIICARKSLYLSYQGRNIRNNNELQPSLVVKELMEYLDLGYGWSLLTERDEQHNEQGRIIQLPMQPFSLRNFIQQSPFNCSSFDAHWLALAMDTKTKKIKNTAQQRLVIPKNQAEIIELSLAQLVSFFDNPSKYFAKQQLNLHFEHYQAELDDTEPFSSDALSTYQFKQALLFAHLSDDDRQLEQVLTQAELSGKFPDLPTTTQEFKKWQQDSQQLVAPIKLAFAQQQNEPETLNLSLPLTISGKIVQLSAKLTIAGKQCLYFKSSSAKPKDLLTLYLSRLFCLVLQQQAEQKSEKPHTESEQAVNQLTNSIGWYFDTKKQQVIEHSYQNITEPLAQLTQFIEYFLNGQQQALLVNINIAERYFKARSFDQADFEKYWYEGNTFMPLAKDPYMQFFWLTPPTLAELKDDFTRLYQRLFTELNSEKITTKTNESAQEKA